MRDTRVGPNYLKLSLAMLICSAAACAESTPSALNKDQRIARNYELARKLYRGYVDLPKLGYVEGWEAEDYAQSKVFGFFDKTDAAGNYTDPVRRWREIVVDKPPSWKDEDRAEYVAILKVIPDFHAVTPFKGFCDENGCALQLCVGGHDSQGQYFEDSEALFFWTNEQGKITRLEALDDWVNMPELIGRIAGLPASEMDFSKWSAAVDRLAGEQSKQP